MPVETKIFDPADGFAPLRDVQEVTDSTVVKRNGRWWMYLAGQVATREIQLFSACLPEGAPLGANGWTLTADPHDPHKIAILGGQSASRTWDAKGGRHCPSYVRGWDPERGDWVERLYYAGAAASPWGPYTIGYLEWDGSGWVDQAAPVFVANQDWERASVYEPNLIYADGRWKMWYVAGSNQQNYLVQGYAESVDGQSNWTEHKIFFPPEEQVFDFAVVLRGSRYEAVFSRVWLGDAPAPANTGLWWCHAKTPSSNISDWSKPVRIMTAENRGWHAGPWKPSVQYGESGKMFVFFDGMYQPFTFTLGCLELEPPE